MRPRDARNIEDILSLRSDNKSTEHGWILLDCDEVTIAAQQPGRPEDGIVTLPRGEFARLIDWYNRDQKPSKP